jgi:3-oxoacyl-[acyl-carrier protein] reductase
MKLGLEGKRALVTGASKGIGAAIARTLAEEGCDLLLVARTKSDLDAVATELRRRTGRKIDVAALDLADGRNVVALASDHDDIDILVNNAGALPGGDVLDIDEETWRGAWDLKVFGYINMCREFYRCMKRRGAGVIVNVIGIGAVMKYPWYICGASGNAAIAAFTNALGGESHKDGVRVLGISPGPVATERAGSVLSQAGTAGDAIDAVRNAFGRDWATADEIASVVAFMASDRASYVSGAVINIDLGVSRI